MVEKRLGLIDNSGREVRVYRHREQTAWPLPTSRALIYRSCSAYPHPSIWLAAVTSRHIAVLQSQAVLVWKWDHALTHQSHELIILSSSHTHTHIHTACVLLFSLCSLHFQQPGLGFSRKSGIKQEVYEWVFVFMCLQDHAPSRFPPWCQTVICATDLSAEKKNHWRRFSFGRRLQ